MPTSEYDWSRTASGEKEAPGYKDSWDTLTIHQLQKHVSGHVTQIYNYIVSSVPTMYTDLPQIYNYIVSSVPTMYTDLTQIYNYIVSSVPTMYTDLMKKEWVFRCWYVSPLPYSLPPQVICRERLQGVGTTVTIYQLEPTCRMLRSKCENGVQCRHRSWSVSNIQCVKITTGLLERRVVQV